VTIKVPKVLSVLDVHIHFRDSYRKDVKNVIISRKDMLDMGKCVWGKSVYFSSLYLSSVDIYLTTLVFFYSYIC